MNTNRHWLYPWLIPFLCLLTGGLALAAFEQDYLWTALEHSLFLHTPLFFRQCMAVPGGLLSWAGAWLTQFFYHPLAGIVLLCLLWAVVIGLLKVAFRIPRRWLWLTLIPVGCLLAADVELGYWIYFLKLRGHLFVPTLGMMVVALLVWMHRSLPRFRLPLIVVTACAGYLLFGFYGLLGAMLNIIYEIKNIKLGRVLTLTAAVAAVAVVPLIYYHTLYHQTPLENMWWTGLPVFVHNGVGDRWLYVPYVVMVLWMVAMVWRPRLPKRAVWLGALLPLVIVAWAWNKDGNFHRELTMSRQMAQQDWSGMLATIGGAKGEPTRAMSMMKNLALQRLGRISEMNSWPDGFARPDAPFPVHAVHTVGKMLYLEYGIPNYCYRWCMEDGVEYGWTAEELKLMVKCSLLNREPVAAQRYLSLLKKTDFHRQWAKKYEAYVRQPALVAQDPEFKAIFPLLRDDDFLTSDQSQLEPFLIEHLASSTGDTPEQQELRNIYFKLYLNRYKYAEK